jgi:hypothetical protein
MSNVLFHGMQEQRTAKDGGVIHTHTFANGFTALVRYGEDCVYRCEVTKRADVHTLTVQFNTAVETGVSFGALFLVNLWLADVAALNSDGQKPLLSTEKEEVPWWDR